MIKYLLNSSKTRVLSLRRAINTSHPTVYLRRVRQAYFPMTLEWNDLKALIDNLPMTLKGMRTNNYWVIHFTQSTRQKPRLLTEGLLPNLPYAEGFEMV